MMSISYYQDHQNQGRECWDRLRYILPLLSGNRDLSILDVGSNMGFFSRELAREQGRLIISMEADREDSEYHLQELGTHGIDNNIVFPVLVDQEIARALGQGPVLLDCVLLLSVVHFFWHPFDEWARMILDFIQSARHSIFELYSTEETYRDRYSQRFDSWYARYPSQPYESLLRSVVDRDIHGRYSIELLGKVRWRKDDPREHRPLLLVTNHRAGESGRVTWHDLQRSDPLRRIVDRAVNPEVARLLPPSITLDVRRFLILLLGLSPHARGVLARARWPEPARREGALEP